MNPDVFHDPGTFNLALTAGIPYPFPYLEEIDSSFMTDTPAKTHTTESLL